MSAVRVLLEREWTWLRDIRLTALKDSPEAFLSNYEREHAYSESDWLAEFCRGEWVIDLRHGEAIGLIGTTREPVTPTNECYLEYMWISPLYRRQGVATDMLENVLKRLASSGVDTIMLWTLDGNEPARRFYEKRGFASTLKRQPLPGDPGRCEELMCRILY
jgi:ribosomal protein S18 acetylase RimI-like enzyme